MVWILCDSSYLFVDYHRIYATRTSRIENGEYKSDSFYTIGQLLRHRWMSKRQLIASTKQTKKSNNKLFIECLRNDTFDFSLALDG